VLVVGAVADWTLLGIVATVGPPRVGGGEPGGLGRLGGSILVAQEKWSRNDLQVLNRGKP
jgi:hypothetical protein